MTTATCGTGCARQVASERQWGFLNNAEEGRRQGSSVHLHNRQRRTTKHNVSRCATIVALAALPAC
jgi:hypothetical protein